MAEGMDLTPDTTCWSRISAIITRRSRYINHKKSEHGKPQPLTTFTATKRDSFFHLLHLTGDFFFPLLEFSKLFFLFFLTLYTKPEALPEDLQKDILQFGGVVGL